MTIKRKGLTLIELVIIIMIIGVVGAVMALVSRNSISSVRSENIVNASTNTAQNIIDGKSLYISSRINGRLTAKANTIHLLVNDMKSVYNNDSQVWDNIFTIGI